MLFRSAVSCPEQSAPLFTLHADAKGRFYRELTTEIAMNCSANVSAPGFAARTYPIASICADYVFDTSTVKTQCATVSLTARLVPQALPSPQPTPTEGGAP